MLQQCKLCIQWVSNAFNHSYSTLGHWIKLLPPKLQSYGRDCKLHLKGTSIKGQIRSGDRTFEWSVKRVQTADKHVATRGLECQILQSILWHRSWQTQRDCKPAENHCDSLYHSSALRKQNCQWRRKSRPGPYTSCPRPSRLAEDVKRPKKPGSEEHRPTYKFNSCHQRLPLTSI